MLQSQMVRSRPRLLQRELIFTAAETLNGGETPEMDSEEANTLL